MTELPEGLPVPTSVPRIEVHLVVYAESYETPTYTELMELVTRGLHSVGLDDHTGSFFELRPGAPVVHP